MAPNQSKWRFWYLAVLLVLLLQILFYYWFTKFWE